jgi:molybdate transport system permease protein
MKGRAVGRTGLVGSGAAALLVLFLGLPVAALLVRAVGIGLVPSDPVQARIVLDALVLSLVTTLVSLLIAATLGTPLAYVLARRSFPGRSIVDALVDLPIVLPPAVAGLALLLLLGRRGLLGGSLEAVGLAIPFTTIAVVVAQTFVAAPFFVRAARSGFAAVDLDLEDAARVDGAGEGAVLRHVTLPLAAPALAGGLVMTWARALGEFGATIMFAGNVTGRTQTLPLVVYGEFQAGDLDAAIAAAAILVLAAFGVLLAVRGFGWRRALDARTLDGREPGGGGRDRRPDGVAV